MCVLNSPPVCFGLATFITVTRGGATKCELHLDTMDIILAIRLMFASHVWPRVHSVNTGLK